MPSRIRSASEHRLRSKTIAEVAARIADEEGWPAVSIRRLALEIGYSQPVLYQHYPDGRQQIIERVVLDGFTTLASDLRAPSDMRDERTGVREVADRYFAFADAHPALYEAMFERPTTARFAENDTAPELRAAFAAILDAIGPDADPLQAEMLWAGLHGLVVLERAGRIPSAGRRARLDVIDRTLRDSRRAPPVEDA